MARRSRDRSPLDVRRAALLAAVGALAASALLLPAGRAQDRPNPTRFYVYNSQGNGFDHDCHGYVWSQMGFLGANGEPASEGRNPNNDLTQGGNDVGDIIGRDANGNANAYRSADGTREAYDLSRGATLAQVWARLDNADTLYVCKHGVIHTHDDGAQHDGGQLQLDGGRSFSGFGPQRGGGGTGVPGPVYPLPARPRGVTAVLYGCWCGRDPDGPRQDDGSGAEISVDESLEAILGPGTVTSFEGFGKSRVAWSLTGGTAEERAAARRALEAAARAAGFRSDDAYQDVSNWIASQPFARQHSTGRDTVTAAGIRTVTFRLEYAEPVDPPRPSTGSECLHACFGGGCRLEFEGATLELPLHALAEPAVFDLHQVDATRLPPPPGALASIVLDTGVEDRLLRPARLTLELFGHHRRVDVYRLDGRRWRKVAAGRSVDKVGGTIAVEVDRVGVFAAFRPGLPLFEPAAGAAGE